MKRLFLRWLPRAPVVAHVDRWTLPGECHPLCPPLCRQGTSDTAILPCPSGPGRHRRSVIGHLLQRRQSGSGRGMQVRSDVESDYKPSVLYRDARPHADGSRIGSRGGHMGARAQGHRGKMRRGPTNLGDPRGAGAGSVLRRRRRRETPPRPPPTLFPLIGGDIHEEPRAAPLPSTAVGQVMGEQKTDCRLPNFVSRIQRHSARLPFRLPSSTEAAGQTVRG